jgi:hypothetical protein
MALHAVWVHGNAVVPEAVGMTAFNASLLQVDGKPWTDVVGLRRGWGVTYRCAWQTSNWFHAPLPTPVIVDGARVGLQRIFVFYDIADWTRTIITDVHVWDGPNRIHAIGGLRLNGRHAQYVEDGVNSWALPSTPWVYWGLSVSLRVQVGPATTDVTFTTAGADLITS